MHGEPKVFFPDELVDEPGDTAMVGDLDAFMSYVENGQALQDWQALRRTANQELEGFLQSRKHTWRHIVRQGTERPCVPKGA